jgi:uncharacterized membrane protein YphA (DoxX/SURF4 family)
MPLTDMLGLGDESATARDGLLSSRAEWHALTIGAGIGFVSGLQPKHGAWLLLILTAVAVGTHRLDAGALGDLNREPHYGLGAAVIAFLATSFLVVPALPRAAF